MTSFSLWTGVPPTWVQKRCCASISCTLRWKCPMAAPVLLGEASCAGRGVTAKTARAKTVLMFMGPYYISLRQRAQPSSEIVSRQNEKFLIGQSRTFLLTQPQGWKDGTYRDEPRGTRLAGLVEARPRRTGDAEIGSREDGNQ